MYIVKLQQFNIFIDHYEVLIFHYFFVVELLLPELGGQLDISINCAAFQIEGEGFIIYIDDLACVLH